ncbi:MAG: hypothetical protein H0T46_25380 [Deltaproteobacteria bacterium]|nr:hypothetical protein [Deltaproteobacteria bacterium]
MTKLVALVAVLVAGSAADARADIATSVYDDAKAVITELITDELSRQIIPRLVCHGRREPCASGECDGPLADFTVDIKGDRYLLSMLYHYQESLQRIYAHQYGSLRSAIRRESEDYAAFQVYETVNGLLYDASEKKTLQSNAVGAFLVARNGADNTVANNPNETTLREAFKGDDLDGENGCVPQVRKNFEANKFIGTRSSPLDIVCSVKETKDIAKLVHGSLKCELALAVRSTLREEYDVAKAHLLRAVATVVQLAVKSNTATLSEVASAIPERALAFAELLHRQPMEPGEPFGLVVKFVGTLTGKALDTDETKWSEDQKVLVKAVRGLLTSWRTISGAENKLELSLIVDQLVSVDGALSSICTMTTVTNTKLCAAVNKLHKEFGRAARYWPLINAAAHADYRQIAHQMIALLFREIGDKKCDVPDMKFDNTYQSDCRYVVYRRFADSLVTYFLDAATDGTPAEGSRAAFRNAAVDVLRDVAALGGMDRGSNWTHRLLPDLELRAGFSPSYGMGGSYSEIRTTAAVRFLSARPILYYTTRHYLALHFSLFDLLAPLAEIKKRPTTGISYDSWPLLANLVTPSASIAYGMPQLSRHLVIGIGATYRIVTPVLTTDMAGANKVTYESWRADGFEIGAFVKYKL